MNHCFCFDAITTNLLPICARDFDYFGCAIDPLQSPIGIKTLFFENQLNKPLACYRPQKAIGAMSHPMGFFQIYGF